MKKFENSKTKKIISNREIVKEVEKSLESSDDKKRLKFLKFGQEISFIFFMPAGLFMYNFKKRNSDLNLSILFFRYVIIYSYLGGLLYLFFNLSIAQFCEKIIFQRDTFNLGLIKFFFRIENKKKYKFSHKYVYNYMDKLYL